MNVQPSFNAPRRALSAVLREAEKVFAPPASPPANTNETPHQKVFRLVGERKFEAAAEMARGLIDSGDVEGFFVHAGIKIEAARDWFEEQTELSAERKRAGWFAITPERAQVLLQANPGNRKINAPGLAKRMRDMATENWSENGETVIVSKCGHLNDGQHRCWASLLIGRQFVTNTSWGVDRDSRVTVDSGIKRAAGGQLEILGVPGGRQKAAIIREYHATLIGRNATDAEVVDFYYANDADVDLAFSLTNNRMPARHNRAPIAAGLFHLLQIGARRDDVERFMGVVRSKLGHKRGCPAFILRDDLKEGKKPRTSREWALAATQHFILWSRGKTVYKLSIPKAAPSIGDL